MKKSIELLNKGFESSSIKTPEFLHFTKVFKKEFTKEMESVTATNIVFSIGHFYISGFFTVNEQKWYFCLQDVRNSEFRIPQLMYREVEDYTDYSGAINHWVPITTLMADKMCWYF